jgi:hypothetical protein
VNRKRVYRLYRQDGLCVGWHKPRRHRSAVTRPARTTSVRVNESWSMDFMADQLFGGRKFRRRTLVDDSFVRARDNVLIYAHFDKEGSPAGSWGCEDTPSESPWRAYRRARELQVFRSRMA